MTMPAHQPPMEEVIPFLPPMVDPVFEDPYTQICPTYVPPPPTPSLFTEITSGGDRGWGDLGIDYTPFIGCY
jgi:hypothetical protein